MRTLVIGLTVLLGSGVTLAQGQVETTKAIVQSYLEIQEHLAADRFEDVKAPARTLVKEAAAIGKAGEPVAKAAAALEAATDLKAAREAFGPLSDAVIARVQAEGTSEATAGLRLAYCPMAKRSWLQREAQVRNPYYGSQMLGCGELKPLKK